MKRVAFTLIKDIQNENEAEAAIMPLVEAIRATGLEPRQDRFLGSFRVETGLTSPEYPRPEPGQDRNKVYRER